MTIPTKCLGRIRPSDKQKHAAPHLNDFLIKPLPVEDAPETCDNIAGAAIAMGGNDEVGDCTIAGAANFFAICAQQLGLAITIVASVLKAFYFSMSGGQDTGLNELDVLHKLATDGLDVGDGVVRRLAVWVRVPMRDHAVVRFLVWKFWALYLGVELADSDLQAAAWTLKASHGSPSPENGHCILVGRYGVIDDKANFPLGFVTWGQDMPGDAEWLDSRCDEGYVLLDQERAEGIGVDWNALLSYVQGLPRA